MTLLGRDFLKESDFSPTELSQLLDLATQLKQAKHSHREVPRLTGRNIALIFAKTSTRTRCAFEIGAYDQGAQVTYLDPNGSQLGHKESVADTAAVLSRFYDAIQYRGDDQTIVETIATHAEVPVYNGLTDQWHPTQSLADQLTMAEHCPKPRDEIAFAFIGDARFNMGNSSLIMGALMGMDVRIIAPSSLQPDPLIITQAEQLARTTGARITITDSPTFGVKGCDFIHTDVWVSMGEPKESWAERIELLRPYQVNSALLASTGMPTKFMHCLPAFHDRHTIIGEQIYQEFGLDGVEVTDEVFSSSSSIVFDQAENRLHTIKAILVATLGCANI